MGELPVMREVVIEAGVRFRVPENLEFGRKIGKGAYGCVCSFTDRATGKGFAVKKVAGAFDDLTDGKRTLREVKLLRNFRHENIVTILDMYPPDNPDFNDVYIVTDLMECDLHMVIHSRQQLSEEHHQFFTYQILRGVHYLHSANVVHRDLTPKNILVNRNCDLKICDFNLARGFESREDDLQMTDYVVTRWYRAPEVVLAASEYTSAIDVWSVGCILCEMIGRKAIFKGRDYLDQIRKIISVIGTPSEEELEWIPGRSGRSFVARLPVFRRQPWSALFAGVSALAHQAIDKMLLFDPTRRLSAAACLALPYFGLLHLPEDEAVADGPVDWTFDKLTHSRRTLQNHLYAECARFYPAIAARDKELLADLGIAELLA